MSPILTMWNKLSSILLDVKVIGEEDVSSYSGHVMKMYLTRDYDDPTGEKNM